MLDELYLRGEFFTNGLAKIGYLLKVIDNYPLLEESRNQFAGQFSPLLVVGFQKASQWFTFPRNEVPAPSQVRMFQLRSR